jgi:hypothetical protein
MGTAIRTHLSTRSGEMDSRGGLSTRMLVDPIGESGHWQHHFHQHSEDQAQKSGIRAVGRSAAPISLGPVMPLRNTFGRGTSHCPIEKLEI